MKFIIKKEISAYFQTPFGFVFVGMFLLLSGITFSTYNLMGGSGDLNGMFGLLGNISFMIFPILTMKLFAEERKNGTENVLLTSKLSITDIVVGKYISAVFVFVVALLATVVYVGIIATYGYANYGGIIASYLGFFLLGITMIAVCVFTSSLADNQVTAAIASFGILFLLVMMQSFSSSIQIPVLTPVLSALAITVPYDEFTRGIFRAGPVCYYIGISIFFLFLAIKNLERKKFD